MTLRVKEIFYCIQGESTFAGTPCVFVRLAGCNLRCRWCDTQYAYEGGEEMTVAGILDRVKGYRCSLVEVTGGEPLTQKETPELVRLLLDSGRQVLLETNGSLDVSPLDRRCVKILDIKCPSSGEEACNDFGNLERLTDRDEIKFVIGNREDYDYARNILDLIGRKTSGKNPIHFSPLCGEMEPPRLAGWILADHLPVRLHLQIHKILWPLEKCGV